MIATFGPAHRRIIAVHVARRVDEITLDIVPESDGDAEAVILCKSIEASTNSPVMARVSAITVSGPPEFNVVP